MIIIITRMDSISSAKNQVRLSLREERESQKIQRLMKFLRAQSPINLEAKKIKYVTEDNRPMQKASKNQTISETINKFLEKKSLAASLQTKKLCSLNNESLQKRIQEVKKKLYRKEILLPLLKTEEDVKEKRTIKEECRSLLLKNRKLETLDFFSKKIVPVSKKELKQSQILSPSGFRDIFGPSNSRSRVRKSENFIKKVRLQSQNSDKGWQFQKQKQQMQDMYSKFWP